MIINERESINESKVVILRDKGKLINNLKNLKLKQGEDVTLSTNDKFWLELFWHEPSSNFNWYPIIQIEYKDKIFFNREGTENPNGWNKLIQDAINAINKKSME